MNKLEILHHVDHTLLAPDASDREIEILCRQALRWQTASVCVSPSRVADAAAILAGRLPVCTVIGFPSGACTTASKVFEAKDALENGAAEIDMVIDLGRVKDGDLSFVEKQICAVKEAVGPRILKVIIETCLLSTEEKIALCGAVTRAGADYIKTSTGFSKAGATPEDVALFAEHVGPDVKIKAAGGISSFDDAEEFVRLGADRLGTSRLVKLAKQAF